MSYHLRLLGRFELLSPTGESITVSSKKNQALIAALAVADGEPVLRSKLGDLLWENRGEEQARNSLRQAFTALRKVFGAHGDFPLLVTEDDAGIVSGALSTDVQRLTGGPLNDDPGAIEVVFCGEFLDGLNIPGVAVQHWILTERQRFRALYGDLLTKRVADLEMAGDVTRAISAAQALLKVDPLNEPAHRAIMRGYARNGVRTKALVQFQVCSDVLRSELGIEPDAETQQLFDDIRQDGSSQITPQTVADSTQHDPVTDMPGIVVLPFDNLSGDPAQDYFCDGLTDSIITDLSRFHDLFVIASASSFAYKKRNAALRDVCDELGVRYALKGGVQRVDGRVRISVQLIDGISGQNLWTERYDRQFDDIFAIQDELTEIIVATLATGYGGRLRKAWQSRRQAIRPNDVKAFDCFMRAIDAVDRFTKEDNQRGREFLLQAVDLDPGYAKAHGKLAWTYILDATEGWSEDYEGNMADARRCALEGIRRDDGEGWARWTLAACELFDMRHDLAISGMEKALELNPNDADVLTDYAWFLSYAGSSNRAVNIALKAMRLNPHHPEWYSVQLGQVYFNAHRYQDAVFTFDSLRSVITTIVCLYLAASHAALGNSKRAKSAIDRAIRLDPQASLRKWINHRMVPYKRPEDFEHFSDNLRKAGLPL